MTSFDERLQQWQETSSASLQAGMEDAIQKKDLLLYQLGVSLYESEINRPTGRFAPQIAQLVDLYYQIYHSKTILDERANPITLICPNCGKSVSSTDKFCASCGFGLQELTDAGKKVCPYCQTKNAAESHFCACCSHSL